MDDEEFVRLLDRRTVVTSRLVELEFAIIRMARRVAVANEECAWAASAWRMTEEAEAKRARWRRRRWIRERALERITFYVLAQWHVLQVESDQLTAAIDAPARPRPRRTAAQLEREVAA